MRGRGDFQVTIPAGARTFFGRALASLALLLCAAPDAARADLLPGPSPTPAPPMPASTCGSDIQSPRDGDTNVPLDATVQIAGGLNTPDGTIDCANVAFERDDHVKVAFDAAVDASSGFVKLTPKQPLEKDRSYTVDLGQGPKMCGGPRVHVEFSTKEAEAITVVAIERDAESRWWGAVSVATAVDVLVSAPLVDASGGGQPENAVTALVDGKPVPVVARSGDARSLSIKFGQPNDSSHLPRTDHALTVRVSPDLKFASGRTLGKPVEVTFVPDDRLMGVHADGSPVTCRTFEMGADACSIAPVEGLGVLGLAFALRRRRR